MNHRGNLNLPYNGIKDGQEEAQGARETNGSLND